MIALSRPTTQLSNSLGHPVTLRTSVSSHLLKAQAIRCQALPGVFNRSTAGRLLFARNVRTPPEKTGRAAAHLRLTDDDKVKIKEMFPRSKPKSLRTENEVYDALRRQGYTPAVDRVDEMLDMRRSPYQSKDLFDNITLGLLLKSSKTVDGGIRNPYRIPYLTAGQNPVTTRIGKHPIYLPASRYFLFPDDTNWATINRLFPLREPPRPWHPIVMGGLRQDYPREEVARRLEWSMVRNAKQMRNGYHWQAPDPEKYEKLEELPQPPPPVIRTCNTCQKPRYLMRFWNFYYQKWQHVSSPHRPSDCGGYKKSGVGRIMYAPAKTMINGVKASQIEDKDWIEEETVLKLLFRSGFIALPKFSQPVGEHLTTASMNGEKFPWTSAPDITRWGMRGGRENGLLDLNGVQTLDKVEKVRKEQEEKFQLKYQKFIKEAAKLLEENPITPEQQAAIPEGFLYPEDHPCTSFWSDRLTTEHGQELKEVVEERRRKQNHKAQIKTKLAEYENVLEEMKSTQAEILLLERGAGELWTDPEKLHISQAKRIKANADIVRNMEYTQGNWQAEGAKKNFVQWDPDLLTANVPSFRYIEQLEASDPKAAAILREKRRIGLKELAEVQSDQMQREIAKRAALANERGAEDLIDDEIVSENSNKGSAEQPSLRWGAPMPRDHYKFGPRTYKSFEDDHDVLLDRQKQLEHEKLQRETQPPPPSKFKPREDPEAYAARYREYLAQKKATDDPTRKSQD